MVVTWGEGAERCVEERLFRLVACVKTQDPLTVKRLGHGEKKSKHDLALDGSLKSQGRIYPFTVVRVSCAPLATEVHHWFAVFTHLSLQRPGMGVLCLHSLLGFSSI